MRNSQKVFNEVGYNLSQEVKDLIFSLDEAKEAVVSPGPDVLKELEQAKADALSWKRKYEEAQRQLSYFQENEDGGEPDSENESESDGE